MHYESAMNMMVDGRIYDGMATGSNVPPRPLMIPVAVQELEKRAESLSMSVDEIAQRLRPVLRPVPPEPAKPVEGQGPSDAPPLVQGLSDLGCRLAAIERRLRDLICRVEF